MVMLRFASPAKQTICPVPSVGFAEGSDWAAVGVCQVRQLVISNSATSRSGRARTVCGPFQSGSFSNIFDDIDTLCTVFVEDNRHGLVRLDSPMEARHTLSNSVAEVGKHLGIDHDTVYRRIDSKDMPAS